MSSSSAFGTPTLSVRSNRGVLVRTLRYNRASAEEAVREYIERTTYDALGRVTSRVDARLFAQSGSLAPNFAYLSSLSGRVLRTDSVDAGTHWTLPDVEGRPVWACDGRGTTTTFTYDALGRPLTVQETFDKQTPAIRDRWIYGETLSDAQAYNLRGQCIYRYDMAGELRWSGFRLTGQPVDETRQLLADAEGDPDWSGQTPGDLAGALDATPYQTAWTHDATGAWVTQTDAKGNVQQRGFDVAGRLANTSLTLAGGTAKPVLSAIDYSAAGQVLTETAGNGAVSTHAYEPETQRLIGLTVTRPAQASRATVVQDLSYEYDPVGNVVQVSDAAQATSYRRNQKIQAAHTYDYDALYQLIGAAGREMANRGQQAQGLPPATIPLPTDDSVYANYTRTYTYDDGGNLATIQHQGRASYTQAIVISATSNHALLQNSTATLTPANIDDGKNTWFDAAGNQRRLVPDAPQPLVWDGRNQLRRVALVTRAQDQNNDDHETYQYGGDGMRVRKRTTTVTSATTRWVDAIYLPGLTLRITSSGDGKTMTAVESVQEVASEAGSIRARCLHWETGLPTSLTNDPMRYGMGDRTGSIGLELDEQAALISREEYYPYGGTAVWTARSQIEADTKFLRYSSKERDVTGLYDYGYRYYQPWLGRWLNTDPAATVDGLNLYRMVRNNPTTLIDQQGLSPTEGTPASTQKVSQHYVTTVFKDINDFHTFVFYSTTHALERGKLPPIPVFVDEDQRALFHSLAKSKLTPTRKLIGRFYESLEFKARLRLEEISRAGVARMDLHGIEDGAKVYVEGHGKPGVNALSSSLNAGERLSVYQVADALIAMGLSADADIRVNSCFSGAGRQFKGSAEEFLRLFHENGLEQVADIEHSFAAVLQAYLVRKIKFRGTVSGYLTETSVAARKVILNGGGQGRHFAGFYDEPGIPRSERTVIKVRKRDVRVSFGSSYEAVLALSRR